MKYKANVVEHPQQIAKAFVDGEFVQPRKRRIIPVTISYKYVEVCGKPAHKH